MNKLSAWDFYRLTGDSELFTREGHTVTEPLTVGFTRKEAASGSLPLDAVSRYAVRYSIGHVDSTGQPMRAKDAIQLEISHVLAADPAKLKLALVELASFVGTEAFAAMVIETLALPIPTEA